jgi:hypothetical protein
MSKTVYKKLVNEGKYVAEVEIEMVYMKEGWSPYLSLDDAYKLDTVRETLKQGNIKAASKLAKIFTLTPVHSVIKD